MTGYECRSCGRDVDPVEEPSPGEPTRCPDCSNDVAREERYEDELRRALAGWGRS